MGGVKEKRIDQGLCPNCGDIAAPYYLCARCRSKEMLGRALRKGAKAGGVRRTVNPADRRQALWGLGDKRKMEEWDYRQVLDPNDARLQPRFRGLPVDVEEELRGILERRGIPMTESEIIKAWGKLRARKGKGSVAEQMGRLIAAEEKRNRKAARLGKGGGDG